MVRIRKAGEEDIDSVIGEVVPRTYVEGWAKNEPEKHLRDTLEAAKAEEHVKAVVRQELLSRGLQP